MKISEVRETDIGVFAITSHGIPIDDGEGHVLVINARESDFIRRNKGIQTAKDMGYENVDAIFLPGRRKITDEEYLEQQHRMEMGLTADPYDIGELIDANKGQGSNGW